MSKDNTNLRLLGSPVNLTYRGKKKDDRKNIKNRPRSALLNSCFTPDNQEGYKRPFSADAKEPPSTRNLFKSYSEVLHSYHNSPIATIKILPPTAELLGNSNANNHSVARDKELCSNASDYGSEDTFISLGTKIKAKAQLNGSKVQSPKKNVIKYKNIAKKGRKLVDGNTNKERGNEYNMEIKITERSRPESPVRTRTANDRGDRGLLLPYTRPAYDSFFIPLEGARKIDEDALAGRVSFGSPSIQAEVEQAIDTYSRRLTQTKHQLSLVEEESTQEVESISQQSSSLTPENNSEDKKNNENNEGDRTGKNMHIVDEDDPFPRAQNFINDTRTYSNFYEDFHTTALDTYQSKNSTVVHTDSSSKDSGYTESGTNDDKKFKINCPLWSDTVKKSNSRDKIDKPKSFDSISTTIDQGYKTLPPDKKWAEPLNHSRLLYKDFFLKKEGHIALPPQNSPIQSVVNNIPSASEDTEETKENDDENLDYPPYLLNSSSKAYTSKVIEDYKKELEAINSLHNLTIKDIQTDAISPTPLNIDKMFEQQTSTFDNKDKPEKNSEVRRTLAEESHNKNSLNTSNKDISKVSTKELIQNYFKVKEADYTIHFSTSKNLKKHDRKISSSTSKIDSNSGNKHDWNNKATRSNSAKTLPVNIKNQTNKNMFTMRAPGSARIESVQTDKDIDSWMSLSAPSPRFIEMHETEPLLVEELNSNNCETSHSPETINVNDENQTHHETVQQPVANTSSEKEEAQKIKELSSNSTVLDIYSMLKDIESFGEMPVTTLNQTIVPETATSNDKKETTKVPTPRDNFTEIFEFLEKVEQSANDALSVVTTTTPQTIPKLEALLKLSHTELAQRMVTASLQLEERSCCIALLQESLTNNKQQMMSKVSNIEKQSMRSIAKVKQECEETIKRHQNFIDQLINDKKTLNHRIEQLVDERRSLEERWKRSAQALEERYKLELRNQHDKMAAAQQVARQRWVRQKAEKIKELTVKGLEGELREMAERQQKEISDIKMYHAEQLGRMQAKQTNELEELRRSLEEEKEAALVKERQLASSRLEKQILELELTYQEQRTRLIAEMRAENERVASGLSEREKAQREEMEKWREQQEKTLSEKRVQLEQHIAKEKEKLEEQMKQRERELEKQFEQYRKEFEAEQQVSLKKKVTEIAAQHKMERDREIEKAIESMEAEAQAGRKELQEALRRNKEQYEAELRELGETEQATLRRYQDAQARIRQTEDKCAEMEVTINQLETRNKVLTEKNLSLESELQQARARCDEAWRQTVDNMRKELDVTRKTHEEQMHQLYAKVKVAVARKDSAIQALTREAAKYQEKITTLEQKLQQQRKDFFKQK